jgi:hypothetical protein
MHDNGYDRYTKRRSEQSGSHCSLFLIESHSAENEKRKKKKEIESLR